MEFSNPHTKTQNQLSAAVFEHYTEKQNDRNLAQAQASDGYIHHHFGLGPLQIDPQTANQETITQEVQRTENVLTEAMIEKLSYDEEPSFSVDLGCGRGGNLFRILDLHDNARVHGVNLNVYQSEVCNEEIDVRNLNERAEVRQANFLSIPYFDGTFTHAYCCEVTQYALDLGILFEEVARVLQSKGRFVIATWVYNDAKDEDAIRSVVEPINDHYASTMHCLNDYLNNLKVNGFKIVEVEDRGADLIPYWELRNHWDMKSGIEDAFLAGHRNELLNYHLIVAEKA